MYNNKLGVLLLVFITTCSAQMRPSFAGNKGIGFTYLGGRYQDDSVVDNRLSGVPSETSVRDAYLTDLIRKVPLNRQPEWYRLKIQQNPQQIQQPIPQLNQRPGLSQNQQITPQQRIQQNPTQNQATFPQQNQQLMPLNRLQQDPNQATFPLQPQQNLQQGFTQNPQTNQQQRLQLNPTQNLGTFPSQTNPQQLRQTQNIPQWNQRATQQQNPNVGQPNTLDINSLQNQYQSNLYRQR